MRKKTWHGHNNTKNAKGITPERHGPTHLFNAILRHQYWPHKLILTKIILIPKPGKDPEEIKSYRPISLITHHRKTTRKTDPPQK